MYAIRSYYACSADGEPNATIISQAYWVDPQRVALSFQFFSKTIRNVRENPRASLCLSDMERKLFWVLDLEYEHSETSRITSYNVCYTKLLRSGRTPARAGPCEIS